jgi:hypothetical protein
VPKFALTCSQSSKQDTEACFKVRSCWSTFHPSQETNAVIRQFISWDSVVTQGVFTLEIADHVKERCASVKGITCQKISGAAVMICTSRVWWLNMQNKQTTVKQYLLKQTSEGGNNKNRNLCQFYAKIVICMGSETEWCVSLMQHHHSAVGWNLCPAQGGVCN